MTDICKNEDEFREKYGFGLTLQEYKELSKKDKEIYKLDIRRCCVNEQ